MQTMKWFSMSMMLTLAVVLVSQAQAQNATTQPAAAATKPAVQSPDTVVATVGENKLTRGELDSIKKFFAPNAPVEQEQQLINFWKMANVMADEAKKGNLESDPDAKVVLNLLGKKFLGDIYVRQQQMKVQVSDQDAKEFYEKSKDSPEFRKGYFISAKVIAAAKKDDIDKMRGEIATGKNFDALFDANKAQTKELTGLSDPEIKNVASNLLVANLGQGVVSAMTLVKEGEVIGPRNFAKGWVLFKVTERKPGELVPFDQVKDEIRNRLLREKQMQISRGIIEKAQNAAGVKPMMPPMGRPMAKPTTQPKVHMNVKPSKAK